MTLAEAGPMPAIFGKVPEASLSVVSAVSRPRMAAAARL